MRTPSPPLLQGMWSDPLSSTTGDGRRKEGIRRLSCKERRSHHRVKYQNGMAIYACCNLLLFVDLSYSISSTNNNSSARSCRFKEVSCLFSLCIIYVQLPRFASFMRAYHESASARNRGFYTTI